MDPFEFSQKMEGMQQGPGDQQAQPMNEADAQAMSAMAAYGRELNQAQYGNAGGLGTAKFQRFNQYFDDQNYRPSIRSAYMPMDLGMTGDPLGAVSGLIEAGGRLFGAKDKDGDGLMDGAFRDMKAKRARNKARRSATYNYDIDFKGNDPSDYKSSAMDLYNASTRGKTLRKKNTLEKGSSPTEEQYLRENAMLKYNPETMEYDVRMKTPDQFRSKNKKIRAEEDKGFEGYTSAGDMQSQMSSLPDYQKQTLRELGIGLEEFKKDKESGNLPEGTQFGFDETTGSYYASPDADMQDMQDNINNAMMTGSFPMPSLSSASWQNFNPTSPFTFRRGGGLKRAQFSTETDGPQSCGDGTVWDFMQQKCVPVGDPLYSNLTTDPGQLTANLIDNQSNPNTTFNQIANMGNQTPPTPPAPTVTRDRGKLGTRLQRGVDNFMNSPLVNAFAEGSKFATAGADFLNEMFKKQRGRQAKQDLLKMSMADNMGVQEGTLLGQGTYDENTGDVFSIMQGVSPFGGNASYYGKHGFEMPMLQDGGEPSWKVGDELTGGTDTWVDWYMSDENEKGRKDRYKSYVFLKELEAKRKGKKFDQSKLPSEDDFHKTYVRAQRQINAIQDFYKDDPDYLKRTDWDSGYEFDPKYKNYNAAKGKKGTKYRGKNFRYKGAIEAINKKIKEDNPDLEDEELNKLLFTALDDAGIRIFQTGYQAGQIMDVAENDEFVKFIQSGIDDDTFTFNGVTYTISPEDEYFGNTTVGQREETIVPIYPCKPCPDGPNKGTVPERDENGECPCGDCPDCPEGKVPGIPTKSEPCPCKEGPKVPEQEEMKAPPKMEPFIQDLLKTQAIADRQRDMFFPWEPAVRRENIEVMLEDPNRAINAANAQYAATAQALGAFGGKSQLAANLSGMAGQTADNVANLISNVNARNVQTVNDANARNAQINMQLNQLEDASKVRQYDNTQKVLQTYMDEKNFDREQYADAMANTITNMANAYNVNQMYDYFNIDPMSGGAIYQSGAKTWDPSPEQDEWAFMNDWMEAAKRAKTMGLVDKNGNVDPAVITGILQAKGGQRNYTDPREEQLRAMTQYMSGYQGDGKKGKEVKKWASPFYTGKMGV
jgi:hypothetical protein